MVMESTCLKNLTLDVISTPLHFHSGRASSLFRSFCLAQLKNKKNKLNFSLSSRCSLSVCAAERGHETSLPNSVGEAVREVPQNKLLQVVLVSPQIPGNTGCIARTCAASAVGLHLVEPLGFQVDDTKLKRAGLDYWPYVVVKVHSSWTDFREYFRHQKGEKGCWHLPREEQLFIQTFPTEELIGLYSAQKLLDSHLKPCLTVRMNCTVVVPFASQ